MRPALEHVCERQTPSASILFLRANLPYVADVKMWRRVRSRSVRNFDTQYLLANKMPPRMGEFQQILQANIFFGSRHPAAAFGLHILKLCTDLDSTLLYILILGAYGKFVWESKMLALGVGFPQTCSSAGCMFDASRSRPHYCQRIFSFPKTNSMKCPVNWNLPRICVCLRNTQPHLNK